MSDDYKKAHAAIDQMARNGVTPTPSNYEFWYHALFETDSPLREDVDALMKATGKVTAHDISRLRRVHFGGDDTEPLEALTKTTEAQIENLSRTIIAAGGDAQLYKSVLETGQINLAKDLPIEQQRVMVEQMARQTSAMIEKSQRLEAKLAVSSKEVQTLRRDLEKARTESRTDMLTGLANRKALLAYLDAQSARAMADRKPLCVIYADIDHFKNFNDTWGHRLGDEVLRLVGQSLEHMCQNIGFPARMGGEEFVIVLPHKSLVDAEDIAEQIRDFVGSKTVRARNTQQTVGRITLSLGVSALDSQDTVESLLERADAALYFAKNNGRNCVATERHLSARAGAHSA